jgi:hypothetical protein
VLLVDFFAILSREKPAGLKVGVLGKHCQYVSAFGAPIPESTYSGLDNWHIPPPGALFGIEFAPIANTITGFAPFFVSACNFIYAGVG